jgi:hypothetical protein
VNANIILHVYITHMKWISIGPTCIGALTLKSIECREESYPFDWIFSSLFMVKGCIEDNFKQFLNRQYITRIGENASTNVLFGKNVFTHHDLTVPETYDSYCRRCQRFMDDFSKGVVLMFMLKKEEHDRYMSELTEFCKFVEMESPQSKVVVVEVCHSNQYFHTLDKKEGNCVVYTVHYGELDNLESFQKIYADESNAVIS